MKRTEFDTFSNAFGQDSALGWCFDWIHYKFGTDQMAVALRGSEEWRRYFEQILPQRLEEFINAFDFGAVKDGSPLWREISDNVDSMTKGASEMQAYIFALLKPFKRYYQEFYLGDMASVMQDVYRNPDYNGEMVVQCYRSLVEAVQRFGSRLDALLLEFGINIQWYQREKGICISPEKMRLERLLPYLDSRSLAERLINEALPKTDGGQPQHEAGQTKGDVELPNEKVDIPEELNNDKAKSILSKAINAGLCNNNYKWLKSKALLAYFADLASEYLGLGKGEYNGKTKTSWKPFEDLFGIKSLAVAKQDFQKTGNLPYGNTEVEKLFE